MCEVKRSKVRGERRLKEDEVPEEEGGGGRQMQKETDLLERPVFVNPGPAHFTDWGEIHNFQHRGGLLRKSVFFFVPISGVRGRHSGLALPGKMGISPPL